MIVKRRTSHNCEEKDVPLIVAGFDVLSMFLGIKPLLLELLLGGCQASSIPPFTSSTTNFHPLDTHLSSLANFKSVSIPFIRSMLFHSFHLLSAQTFNCSG